MTPSDVILDALVDLLSKDPATLSAATAMHVHPVMAPFTPGPGLEIADFTLATFAGSAALDAGVGDQTVFTDPITGLRTIQLLEPAGGWTWICTADPVAPQTIYGYVVTDTADAVVLGCMRRQTNVVISADGQGFSEPYIRFQLSANPLS